MNSTSCKICGNTVGLNGFSKHLKTYHNISCVKDYYDQYMKTELEGLCKTCGKPTKFKILTEGYAEFCCRRCASQGTVARRQQTCLKRYGAEHPMHVEEFREKVSAKLCKDVHKYEAKLPKDHTCQICRKQFSSRGMGQHLQKTHRVSVKDYYDQYLKKPKEGLCKTCGKPTAFRTFTSGYSSYCCQYCTTQDPEVAQRASQTRKKTLN